MMARVFWIDGPWAGRLAIVPRPRGGDWLPDDVAAWRAAGLDVVVSLLEPPEAADLKLGDEGAAAAANGMAFSSYPIPDRGVPADTDSAVRFAADLLTALKAGRNVGVHCRQSVGRSGVIAAAVLMLGGLNVDEAVRAVSDARGLPVPETAEQRQWLTDIASDKTR